LVKAGPSPDIRALASQERLTFKIAAASFGSSITLVVVIMKKLLI
jgi:hypothetical protein